MGRIGKPTITSVTSIWVTLILAIALWNYILVFRIPSHVQSAYENQSKLPIMTTRAIDFIDNGVIPWAAKIWAVVATVTLFWKRRDDRSKFLFPHLPVIGVFITPFLIVSAILALPEFQ